MFQALKYIESMSVKLSEVLSDIGVNERIVQKRRRLNLIAEYMETRSWQLRDYNVTAYYFGSQSEGTTTLDLKSDIDMLTCVNDFNVIQDKTYQKPGVEMHLMIQDHNVSPGYCLLQPLGNKNSNYTIPNNYISTNADEHLNKAFNYQPIRQGPAETYKKHGEIDADRVGAFRCKSWPLQAHKWLDWQGVGQWPSADMKKYCASTGCFLVGVGSKGSKHKDHEWRISTSLAERHLMFSLNITQIRCYVLMKIIITTFIKPDFKGTITSYMCKTVLFHCIANTNSFIWRENNILGCLSFCLFVLLTCITNGNCPHFIIPGNNLMKGKIPYKDKPYILQKLYDVVADICKALLGIECDGLGLRLQDKMNSLGSLNACELVSGQILILLEFHRYMTMSLEFDSISISKDEEVVKKLLKYIYKLEDISNQCEGVDKTACHLLKQGFCTSLGTALASCSIRLHNIVSARALTWIFRGLNTDVSSGKLKLASIYYCTGDIQRTESILMDIERNYDVNTVEPVCFCYLNITKPLRKGFCAISNDQNEEAVHNISAFCVKVLPYEIKFVPNELKYEMLRSTKEDLAFTALDGYWMKWAVVDSLPYLYFLQYKIYKNLGRQADKKRALSNLLEFTAYEPNLGHRETALNLLGQCMEQEGRATDALRCYLISLKLMERFNAARIHICRLLSSLIINKKRRGKALVGMPLSRAS